MNSRMLMCTSLCLLWSGREKWRPTNLSWSPKKMSRRWWTNLSFSLRGIYPTYCTPHLLHVMAEIKLELLQEPFVMQLRVNLVIWEVIFPVLLMKGQYLHRGVLQKLNPLSFGADPCLLVLGRPVIVGSDGPGSGATSWFGESRFHVSKSVIGCCFCQFEIGEAEVPPVRFEGSGAMAGGWDVCVCRVSQLVPS